MPDFSYMLRKLRTERGLRQKDIANAIGVSAQAYSAYERGLRDPSIKTVKKIANVLGVSADELLGMDIEITTRAAHFDGTEYTEEQLDRIEAFAKFIKQEDNK